MTDANVIRWPYVIAHAAIALVLASIFVGLPVGTFATNAWTALTIWVVAAVVAFLATGLASYLKQAGNSSGTYFGAAGAVIVVGVGVALWYNATAAPPWNGPLTEVSGRLEQPLGFSLQKPPPPFAEASQLEASAKLAAGEAVYVFVDHNSNSSLEVEVRRSSGTGRHAVEEVVNQRAAWLQHSGSGGAALMQVEGANVEGDDANPIGRIQAQGKGHFLRSTYHLLHAHDGNYVIALIVVSGDPNLLSDVLESYRTK